MLLNIYNDRAFGLWRARMLLRPTLKCMALLGLWTAQPCLTSLLGSWRVEMLRITHIMSINIYHVRAFLACGVLACCSGLRLERMTLLGLWTAQFCSSTLLSSWRVGTLLIISCNYFLNFDASLASIHPSCSSFSFMRREGISGISYTVIVCLRVVSI